MLQSKKRLQLNQEKIMETGKVYNIDHTRKGQFIGRIVSQDDEWCDVEILEGEATYTSKDTDNAVRGEVITVRKSLMYCTPVNAQ